MFDGCYRLYSITALAGCSLWVFTGIGWAGPLDDYLAHPPKYDNAPWPEGCEPAVSIPKWQKAFKEGNTDSEKAIAVGNLVVTAERMANFPDDHAAAIELMDKHVMPNLEVTKNVDITLFCAWRGIVLHCADFYKKMNKPENIQTCLEMYIFAADNPHDKNFGIYRLANHFADQEQYAVAIRTIEKILDEEKMSTEAQFKISIWEKKLKEKETKPAKEVEK